jgi:dehydrogenase/reductase SDR family protein 12
MTLLTEHITTALDRESAFRYVADFARQSEWDPNTLSSRRVDPGELGVGSRFALEVKVGRKAVPMEYRITEFDPPAKVVLVGEGSGVWSQDVITFTDTPDGTRVDYSAEIRLSGLLGLAQPLLGRAFATLGRRAVEGMKRELDRLAGASAAA